MIGELITLGIGTPATIAGLLTLGLSIGDAVPEIPARPDVVVRVRARAQTIDVQPRVQTIRVRPRTPRVRVP